MKVRPLHDRILVKRIEEEEKSKGGASGMPDMSDMDM